MRFVVLDSPVEVMRSLIAGGIARCGMLGSDYRLDWFVSVTVWRRLFLSRFAKAKVYQFFGIPIWVRLYTSEGIPLTYLRVWEWIMLRLGRGNRT